MTVKALADRIAGWFVPFVLLASVLTWVFWFVFGILDYSAINSPRVRISKYCTRVFV